MPIDDALAQLGPSIKPIKTVENKDKSSVIEETSSKLKLENCEFNSRGTRMDDYLTCGSTDFPFRKIFDSKDYNGIVFFNLTFPESVKPLKRCWVNFSQAMLHKPSGPEPVIDGELEFISMDYHWDKSKMHFDKTYAGLGESVYFDKCENLQGLIVCGDINLDLIVANDKIIANEIRKIGISDKGKIYSKTINNKQYKISISPIYK